jgi:hypothetical protein
VGITVVSLAVRKKPSNLVLVLVRESKIISSSVSGGENIQQIVRIIVHRRTSSCYHIFHLGRIGF